MNNIFIILSIFEKLLQPELLTTLSSFLEVFSNFLQVATNFVNSVVAFLTTLVTLLELNKRAKKEPRRNRPTRRFK